MKLMSVLHEVICAGIEFQRDAPAKEKLFLNMSILGLREREKKMCSLTLAGLKFVVDVVVF